MNTADINAMFVQLLRRPLNEHELSRLEGDGANPWIESDPADLAQSIIGSDEFFMRWREVFIEKFFPDACFVTAQTPIGQKIIVNLRELHLGFSIARATYEPNETKFILSNVKAGMTVLVDRI